MIRRCRRCTRPLKSSPWRELRLGRDCARKLGLTLARPRLVPIAGAVGVRPVAGVDGQMELFEITEEGVAWHK